MYTSGIVDIQVEETFSIVRSIPCRLLLDPSSLVAFHSILTTCSGWETNTKNTDDNRTPVTCFDSLDLPRFSLDYHFDSLELLQLVELFADD